MTSPSGEGSQTSEEKAKAAAEEAGKRLKELLRDEKYRFADADAAIEEIRASAIFALGPVDDDYASKLGPPPVAESEAETVRREAYERFLEVQVAHQQERAELLGSVADSADPFVEMEKQFGPFASRTRKRLNASVRKLLARRHYKRLFELNDIEGLAWTDLPQELQDLVRDAIRRLEPSDEATKKTGARKKTERATLIEDLSEIYILQTGHPGDVNTLPISIDSNYVQFLRVVLDLLLGLTESTPAAIKAHLLRVRDADRKANPHLSRENRKALKRDGNRG